MLKKEKNATENVSITTATVKVENSDVLNPTRFESQFDRMAAGFITDELPE